MKKLKSTFIIVVQSIIIIIPFIMILYSLYGFISHGIIIYLNNNNRNEIDNILKDNKLEFEINDIKKIELIDFMSDRLKIYYNNNQSEILYLENSNNISTYFKKNGTNYNKIIFLIGIIFCIPSFLIISKESSNKKYD